jgi:hypothetical protein
MFNTGIDAIVFANQSDKYQPITLAVTMQLNQSRLLDLFAQELRRSALTDFLSNMRALHSLFCAKIYFAAASLSNAWSRLR